MSYFLSDATGYLRDFGSGGMVDRFTIWANRQEPIVKSFAQEGHAPQPLILAAALARTKPPADKTVAAMRDELLAMCKTAEGALAIFDGAGDTIKALIGNGSNQYVSKGTGADKTNTGKALAKLAKLPALSHGDPNFKQVPFEQGQDRAVAALEKRDMPNPTVVEYDPASGPLATQDYVEADKVADIIKQESSGGNEVGGLPKIANFKGRDYIVDGHHRMAAALLTGQNVRAHYYKVK